MDAQTRQMLAIIIAAIITAVASLFGPTVAVLVKARIDQPKPKPKTNQAPALKPLSTWQLIKRDRWRFLIAVGLNAVCIRIIVTAVMNPYPATSRSVVVIAGAWAGFVAIALINLIWTSKQS